MNACTCEIEVSKTDQFFLLISFSGWVLIWRFHLSEGYLKW